MMLINFLLYLYFINYLKYIIMPGKMGSKKTYSTGKKKTNSKGKSNSRKGGRR